MIRKVRVVGRKSVFKGDKFNLLLERFKIEKDGRVLEVEREVDHGPNTTIILPLFKNKDILCIKEFRYPLRKWFYELPAGTEKKGEPILKTAKRELLEETGYKAKKWVKLGEFYYRLARTSTKTTIFLAENLENMRKKHLERYEMIKTKRMSLKEFERLFLKNRKTEGNFVLAYYLAKEKGFI